MCLSHFGWVASSLAAAEGNGYKQIRATTRPDPGQSQPRVNQHVGLSNLYLSPLSFSESQPLLLPLLPLSLSPCLCLCVNSRYQRLLPAPLRFISTTAFFQTPLRHVSISQRLFEASATHTHALTLSVLGLVCASLCVSMCVCVCMSPSTQTS